MLTAKFACTEQALKDGFLTALETCERIINLIPVADYGKKFEDASSIGAHMRHILEMIQEYHLGIKNGRINYDARKRDLMLETVPQKALKMIEQLRSHLPEREAKTPIILQAHCAAGLAPAEIPSTIGRETQYMIDHVIHHLAFIRILALRLGIILPKEDGVAPATLHHQAASG